MSTNTATFNEVPLSWFGKILWKYTPLYAELVGLAICLRLLGIVEPFLFQVIIDRILPFQREATLIVVTILFGLTSLFHIGFSILSSLLGILTANRVTQEFGAQIFDHLFKLPFSHFRKWTVGETIARIGETDTIRSFIVGATTGTLLDMVFVSIYIAILYALSPTLTFIILVALPLQAILYFGFGPFLRTRLKKQFDADAAHSTQMVENISGIAAVKALSAEAPMLERLNSTLAANLQAVYRVSMLQLINGQLIFFANQFVTIAIIFVGANLVFSAEMTLGQLIAFHLLSGKVSGPISSFATLWESWQNVRVSRQRLGDILNKKTEAFGELPKLPSDIGGDLRLQDVSFSYVEGEPIIQRLNVELTAGCITAIVGSSGIGKSTFARLAAGIDTASSGIVSLDGLDISQYDPHDVRAKVAYIPQEPYLFHGTIRENLLIGVKGCSDSEIHRALVVAAADQMIEQLPQGLDTQVGERGSALSGGQRQRIAIARSVLVQPRVLILDEPTSALDSGAQQKMIAQLAELAKSITIVVITHSPDMFPANTRVVDFEELL